MSKSALTKEIEKALKKRFHRTPERYATEVAVGNGRKSGIVDLVTADFRNKQDKFINHLPMITCYEIKISLSDFKSEHGHTLIGDNNYYVVTQELFDKIMSIDPRMFGFDAGIITYRNGRLSVKRESKQSFITYRLTIEQRFGIIENMLMQWINGNVK